MFVNWTAPAGKESFVSGYEVEWERRSDNSQTGNSTILSNDTVQYNISSNVDSGRAYKVKVITRSRVAYSPVVKTSVEKEQALSEFCTYMVSPKGFSLRTLIHVNSLPKDF